jgi:hypothetical protein
MDFIYNDGGRLAAGYKGTVRDCVCRSISIITGIPYQQVYKSLSEGTHSQRLTKYQKTKRTKSAANGINVKRKWFKDYMKSLGFTWIPLMKVGEGCKVHLRKEELPEGRLVVQLSNHFTAVIDGVIHDNHDCSRGGARCVYGYYILNK